MESGASTVRKPLSQSAYSTCRRNRSLRWVQGKCRIHHSQILPHISSNCRLRRRVPPRSSRAESLPIGTQCIVLKPLFGPRLDVKVASWTRSRKSALTRPRNASIRTSSLASSASVARSTSDSLRMITTTGLAGSVIVCACGIHARRKPRPSMKNSQNSLSFWVRHSLCSGNARADLYPRIQGPPIKPDAYREPTNRPIRNVEPVRVC